MEPADRDEIFDTYLRHDLAEPLKKVQVQDYMYECRRQRVSILAHLNSGLKDILMVSDPQVRSLVKTEDLRGLYLICLISKSSLLFVSSLFFINTCHYIGVFPSFPFVCTAHFCCRLGCEYCFHLAQAGTTEGNAPSAKASSCIVDCHWPDH